MSKGLLEGPPGEAELARCYYELARNGAPCVGKRSRWSFQVETLEALLALSAEMMRYDARLLTILLQLILRKWDTVNPLRLRLELRKSRWPQALLVVFEFARVATNEREIGWMADYLAAGIPRVSASESFFIGMVTPGSRTALRRTGRNLAPYARFGYIGTERPVADMETRRTVGRYDASTRRRILAELLEKRSEITLSEYLNAVDNSISRQQALDDLRRSPGLQMIGRGRGSRWICKG